MFAVFFVCRAVTESINQLITACAVSAAPGQKECDAAVRQIEVSTPCTIRANLPITKYKLVYEFKREEELVRSG